MWQCGLGGRVGVAIGIRAGVGAGLEEGLGSGSGPAAFLVAGLTRRKFERVHTSN